MPAESIEQRLRELDRQLDALPEAEEPPPTTLQVLGQSRKERHWQQLLVHFLSPDEAHRLGTDVLEQILDALSDDSSLDFSYSRLDLDEVGVAQEVSTGQGRPDLVVWVEDRWFLCIEIKVNASEGDDQTCRYVKADAFEGIGLAKSDVPADGHHYVYLAPKNAPPPEADEFVQLSWEWVASELQSYVAETYGEIPTRTTAQLNDFVDTIRSEMTMTDYQENQQEKTELYLEYLDIIHELQDAFDEEWETLENEWGNRLASSLSGGTAEEVPSIPDEYVAFRLDSRDERWIFRQTTSDWAWIFKDGWWRDADSGDHIYDHNKPDARIGFFHRLDYHKEEAIRGNELRFFFRNTPPNVEEFFERFSELVTNERFESIVEVMPNNMEVTGKPRMMAEGSYDIDVDSHDNFTDAYISALEKAFVDHVVQNEELIKIIDNIYEKSFNKIDK